MSRMSSEWRRCGAAVLIGLAVWVLTATGQQPPAAPVGYVPGEIIVKFQAQASSTRRNAVLAAHGTQLIRRFLPLDVHHLRLPPGLSVPAAIAAFRADPEVIAAEPNFIR